MQSPFLNLLPSYTAPGQIQPGRFASIRPLDPHLPTQTLTESLRRYLQGDVHELDPLVAESLRETACKLCLSGDGRGLDHYCAAVLLTHLHCFDGAGFGHTEMPIVIATSVLRDRPSWQEPSAHFLRELLHDHATQQLGERAAFMALALRIIEDAAGTTTSQYPLVASDLLEANENNEDLYASALVQSLASEARRANANLPDETSRLLNLFSPPGSR